MAKELCVMHANCQGDALKVLLEASPEFAAKFRIRHLRNYLRESLDQGLLDSTAVFLHQYLTEKWGEISTAQVLGRLHPAATSICIPNCFFKGYWPFWKLMPDVMDFPDSFLEELIKRDLPLDAMLSIYMKADPSIIGDVEKIALDSLDTEKRKEAHSPIKYVWIMEERWRSEQLFLTINHPGPRILTHIAQEILKMLGLEPIPDSFIRSFVSPHNDFWLPIHPAVGARLNLPFAAKDRRYPCFGQDLTHREYVLAYLACRKEGIRDLANALASLAKNQPLAQASNAH